MVATLAQSEAEARLILERRSSVTAVFVPDNTSIDEFVLSERMRDVTAEVAAAIRDLAGRTAKRDSSSERNTQHYADSFYVEREGGTMVVDRKPRVMVIVANDDPVASINEWGHGHIPRRRTLGQAGAAYGDFKPDGGPT